MIAIRKTMPKLYMMKGLTASGKTTMAKDLVKRSKNSIFRTSLDDLRLSLFLDKKGSFKEFKVRNSQESIIDKCLSHGISCIVDNDNLKPVDRQRWFKLAQKNGADFHTLETKHVIVTDCVKRDGERDNPVGDHVIWKDALKNHMWISWNGVMLVDIDGTLADIGERIKHVQGEHKDWESFFAECNLDTFREDVWDEIEEILDNSGYDLFLVTGRNEKYRAETIKWFNKHCPEILDRAKCMFMRAKNDFRPDTEVKEDMLKMFGVDDVRIAYDDRPSVIRMYQKHKIATVDCGDGVDF